MTTRRKLSAILSADVVGYSKLMEADDEATVATLKAHRDVIFGVVAAKGGRVVNAPGDAVLCEFGSAQAAVGAAVEIQRSLADRNGALQPERQMQFRIGVDLGDVIEEEDGTIYGDGVNIAARLQSLSKPGGICVSGMVHDAVEGKLDIVFQHQGEQQVRNIAKPIRVYKLQLSGEGTSRPGRSGKAKVAVTTAAMAFLVLAFALATQSERLRIWESAHDRGDDPVLAIPSGPGIAVLPFDNMSGDPTKDYFADGISEEIIAGLSRFQNLRVIARNSTFQFKGKSKDLREIGKALGADYVVEGSVRRGSSSVRVTAQLIEASTGTHLWAETYDRHLDTENLFAVQDDITDQVVTRIGDVRGAVNQARLQQVRSKSSASLADYECILLTYEYQRFLTPDKHAVVKDCLLRTVRRNPQYAEAWANLAYAYVDQYWAEYAGPVNALELAREAAERAVKLDPSSPVAHFALANVFFFQKDLDAFFIEAEKALALNPNNTEIVAALSVRFTFSGNSERGLALMRKAIALNPAHPGWYWNSSVYHNYWNKDYQKSLETAKRASMPGFFYWYVQLAMNYGQLGDRQRAQDAVQQLRQANPRFENEAFRYLQMWFSKAQAAHVVEGLRKAGMAIPDEKL